MKIVFLCTDINHPVVKILEKWIDTLGSQHQIMLINSPSKITTNGDMLFLISCSSVVPKQVRNFFTYTLVIHASDLPTGRGWSPHIWEILNHSHEITVSLLEAEDKVDTGCVWKKIKLSIPKHFLWDEINALLFDAEIHLIEYAINHVNDISPVPQIGEATYYPKRLPQDSEINPKSTIEEQFDLIRICDPNRFPAFFYLHGHKYKLTIEKYDE